MREAVVLHEVGGLRAFARARSAEDVDDGYFLWVEGRCGVGGGRRGRWLEGRVCARCRVYWRHVEWAKGVVVVLLRRDQLDDDEGCGRSPLVSTRLACFAGDLGLRLARTGPDHVHVAAAAGQEDGEEGEEA